MCAPNKTKEGNKAFSYLFRSSHTLIDHHMIYDNLLMTDQYRLELSNKFQLLAELGDSESENDSQGIGTDTEQVWQRLKVSILDSARETLSVKRTQSNQAWITPETLALIEEKRSCSRDSDQYRR